METRTAPTQQTTNGHAEHPTPEMIMKIGMGFWASKILLTAVRFELFTHLASQGGMSTTQVKQALGLKCSDRHTMDFLDTLTGFGFLERKGLLADAVYTNGADTAFFLDKKKPSYLGGILEMADVITVNKADGENVKRAESAASDYRAALQIFTPHGATWFPPVVTVSGRENRGLDEMWAKVLEHRTKMTATGEFATRRRAQAVSWMRDMLEDRLMGALRANPQVAAELPRIEDAVAQGALLPTLAVDRVMGLMGFSDLAYTSP